MANTHIKIKQIRSASGRLPNHIVTIKALGLGKIGREVILPNTPTFRGMVYKVHYLLDVSVVQA